MAGQKIDRDHESKLYNEILNFVKLNFNRAFVKMLVIGRVLRANCRSFVIITPIPILFNENALRWNLTDRYFLNELFICLARVSNKLSGRVKCIP